MEPARLWILRPPLGENVVTSGTGSRRYREIPLPMQHDRISCELKSTSLEPPGMSGTTEAQAGDLLAFREKQGYRWTPRKARDGLVLLGGSSRLEVLGSWPLGQRGEGCNERTLMGTSSSSFPQVLLQTSCSVTRPECTVHRKPTHRGQE